MGTAQSKWVVKGVSKSLRDQINELAKTENVSNGKLIQSLLENAASYPKAQIKSDDVKSMRDVRTFLRQLDRRVHHLEDPEASNLCQFESKSSNIPKVNVNTHVFDGLVDKGKEVWSSLLGYVRRK